MRINVSFISFFALIYNFNANCGYISLNNDVQMSYSVPTIGLKDLSVDASTTEMDSKLAVVIGAGPSGLISALILEREGYKVIVLEKRKPSYTRLNMVTLKSESAQVLSYLGLFEDFKETIAAQIDTMTLNKSKNEKTMLLKKILKPISMETINYRLSKLGTLPPETFTEGGVYTFIIAQFEQFLATAAINRGVSIVTDVNTEILSRKNNDNEVESYVRVSQGVTSETFYPKLLILATGRAGISMPNRAQECFDEHPCNNEQWIVGAVGYDGKESFSISEAKFSEDNKAPLTASIFNSKIHQTHIGVIYDQDVSFISLSEIKTLIQNTAKRHFAIAGIEGEPELKWVTDTVVKVANLKSTSLVFGTNLVLTGDQIGVSSPLVGLGMSMATSIYPLALQALAKTLSSSQISSVDRMEALKNYEKECFSGYDRWLENARNSKENLKQEPTFE